MPSILCMANNFWSWKASGFLCPAVYLANDGRVLCFTSSLNDILMDGLPMPACFLWITASTACMYHVLPMGTMSDS